MSETLQNYSEDDGLELLEQAVTLEIVEEEPATTPKQKVGKFAVGNVVELLGQTPVDNEPDEQISSVILTNDSVKDYLRSIGKVPLLRPEEEVSLAMDIEVGLMAGKKIEELLANDPEFAESEHRRELTYIQQEGKKAFDRFVSANLRLSVNIAKHYQGKDMDFLELIQEGNAGVIRAVEKFDYQKGWKFSTYASWWIRQTISRAIADQARTIRIPVHMVESMNKMTRTRAQMAIDLQRDPTPQEIGRELNIPTEKVVELIRYNHTPMSLNTKLGDDQETEFGDLISDGGATNPEDTVEEYGRRQAVKALIDTLNERESFVIRNRFGLDGGESQTLDAIAAVLELTRERVRQIEKAALRKLQNTTRADDSTREYLT